LKERKDFGKTLMLDKSAVESEKVIGHRDDAFLLIK
jgi:hypothetical protein